jgi:hypothetical protein
MITRRDFLTRAAVGVAAVLGFAAAHKTEQSSAQGNPEPALPIKPTAAREMHRVEAKIKSIHPEAWNVRTYEFIAKDYATIPGKTSLSNAKLRALKIIPLGDLLPSLIVLPSALVLWPGDTVLFTIDRSALKYNPRHTRDEESPYMMEFR